MKINIISNIVNGKGLQADSELFADLLKEMGHEVVLVHFHQPHTARAAAANLFLETVVPSLFGLAEKNYLMPNPEWVGPEVVKWLKTFDGVLCKTHHAFSSIRELTPKAIYTGFLSADNFDETVKREEKFLHTPGDSAVKNTIPILRAWEKFNIPYPLTVVSDMYKKHTPITNDTFLGRQSRPELIRLQNEHFFHLCPSEYEGWGHSIHEGLGVGAIVITTDAPPMNEYKGCPGVVRVKPGANRRLHLADMRTVEPEAVRDAIETVMSLGSVVLKGRSRYAMECFESYRPRFKKTITEIFGEGVAVPVKPVAQPVEVVNDYGDTLARIKKTYYYPKDWKGSYANAAQRDVHTLLDIIGELQP